MTSFNCTSFTYLLDLHVILFSPSQQDAKEQRGMSREAAPTVSGRCHLKRSNILEPLVVDRLLWPTSNLLVPS